VDDDDENGERTGELLRGRRAAVMLVSEAEDGLLSFTGEMSSTLLLLLLQLLLLLPWDCI
jgi:hypothetical protein